MIFNYLAAKTLPTKLRFIGLIVSFILMSLAGVGLMTHSLNFSIEFNGGFITEFQSTHPLDRSEISASITNILGAEHAAKLQ